MKGSKYWDFSTYLHFAGVQLAKFMVHRLCSRGNSSISSPAVHGSPWTWVTVSTIARSCGWFLLLASPHSWAQKIHLGHPNTPLLRSNTTHWAFHTLGLHDFRCCRCNQTLCWLHEHSIARRTRALFVTGEIGSVTRAMAWGYFFCGWLHHLSEH